MQHIIRLALASLLFVLTAFMWGCDSSGSGGPSAEELALEAQLAEEMALAAKKADDIALEAQRVKSIGKLLEHSARQPEMIPQLTEQHEAFSHFDGQYLLEIHSPLLEARIVALGKYIEGSASQPEIEPQLKNLFNSHAGFLTPEDIGKSETALYYRMLTLSKLLEAAATQPEMVPMLKENVATYLGRFEDYPLDAMTTPLVMAGRVQMVGKYIQGVARQPEMETVLDEIMTEFAGDKSLVVNSTECLVNAARLEILSELTEATARHPEFFLNDAGCSGEWCGKLTALLEEQAGPIQRGDSSSGCRLPETLWGFY